MTTDEQEARSRLYGNSIVILVPLSSGTVACFNNSGTLCGIAPTAQEAFLLWRPVVTVKTATPTLEELFEL